MRFWKRRSRARAAAQSPPGASRGEQEPAAVKPAETEVPRPLLTQGDYRLAVSFCSDTGCVREINEDACLYIQPDDEDNRRRKGALFLVADGMGGHVAGEIASRTAVESISTLYYESPLDEQAALCKAFNKVNQSLLAMSQRDERLKGMGTTCTALAIANGCAFCAHLGDSRLYLVRDGAPYIMTEDHSQVMEMVRRGLLSREEARLHPDKNIILRALGTQAKLQLFAWQKPFPLRLNDRLLLCSDGLTDFVGDDEIARLAVSNDPHSACEQLVSLAKERGGYDNITVGIIGVERPDKQQQKPVRQTRESEVVV